MVARKCDRCGALYERYGKNRPALQVHLNRYPVAKGLWYDLCPECQEKLEDWMALAEFEEETYGEE